MALQECPNCESAKLITNPNYLKEKAESLKQEETEYTQTLERFQWKSYHTVIQKCNEIIYPHTDSRTKLLSMVYYLSDDDVNYNPTLDSIFSYPRSTP